MCMVASCIICFVALAVYVLRASLQPSTAGIASLSLRLGVRKNPCASHSRAGIGRDDLFPIELSHARRGGVERAGMGIFRFCRGSRPYEFVRVEVLIVAGAANTTQDEGNDDADSTYCSQSTYDASNNSPSAYTIRRSGRGCRGSR